MNAVSFERDFSWIKGNHRRARGIPGMQPRKLRRPFYSPLTSSFSFPRSYGRIGPGIRQPFFFADLSLFSLRNLPNFVILKFILLDIQMQYKCWGYTLMVQVSMRIFLFFLAVTLSPVMARKQCMFCWTPQEMNGNKHSFRVRKLSDISQKGYMRCYEGAEPSTNTSCVRVI